MLEATRCKVEELMAFRGVRVLYEACEAAHQALFEDIMQSVDDVRFHWQLGLLAESHPPTDEAMRAYLERQQLAKSDR